MTQKLNHTQEVRIACDCIQRFTERIRFLHARSVHTQVRECRAFSVSRVLFGLGSEPSSLRISKSSGPLLFFLITWNFARMSFRIGESVQILARVVLSEAQIKKRYKNTRKPKLFAVVKSRPRGGKLKLEVRLLVSTVHACIVTLTLIFVCLTYTLCG